MSRNHWPVTFLIFVSFLILAFGFVTSAYSGESATSIYLPIVQGPYSPWQEVGLGSASGDGISNTPGESSALAIAPDGTLYVAWVDYSEGGPDIYVRRWHGGSWEEVGANSASGGGISNTGWALYPSIAIAPDGTPYVAWEDYSNQNENDEIYVRVWNGTNWAEIGTGSASSGGISNNAGLSERASVAVAPNGTPYLAWRDDTTGNEEIYVRVWNGSNWAEVGASSASGGGISNNSGDSRVPSLAIAPDGTPYIVWDDLTPGDREIYIRMWNGSNWAEVGVGSANGLGISNNSGLSSSPSLSFSPTGTPYVAWMDYAGGNPEIYIRFWTGSSWAELGPGSASGGGISNSGNSSAPSLALAQNGTPYVAWSEYVLTNTEIYIRRWNGSAWEEVGAGSASDGGITNNPGISESVSLAIAPEGVPYLSWSDGTNAPGSYIYLLRYIE